MPRRCDPLDPRAGKKFPDRRLVVRMHVARFSARHEQHVTFKPILSGRQRIFFEFRQRPGQRRQVHGPLPFSGRVLRQIRRQEFPHRPIVHPRLELQLRLRARAQMREIEFVHRRKLRAMRRPAIILRRDVHHDQPLHALRSPARQQHRRLSTHAVSQQRWPLDPASIHPLHDVFHHDRITHFVRMRRLPVIPQIEREHIPPLAQIPPRRLPVSRRPQQPVQNHQRRLARASEFSMEKFNHTLTKHRLHANAQGS